MNGKLGPDLQAQLACLLEATARKPGNVHRCREFDDAGYLDFALSATVLARHLHPALVREFGVGKVVLRAVRDTRALVGHNTNLGMILLLTPMAGVEPDGDLRDGLARVLGRLTVADAVAAFEAIRLARPGGLGEAASQDVAGTPTVTLLDAMRLAADRDAIARQYATDYADVFERALPALADALRSGRPLEVAIVASQLRLMADRPDTLILRKCGPAVADESARRAADVLDAGWPDAPGSVDALRALDTWLRGDGHRRNPGATADLIAATLYAALADGTIEVPRHLARPGWHGGDRL